MNTSIENIVCVEFMKKKVFELLTLAAAFPTRGCHGRQKVSIHECDHQEGE